MDRLIQIQEREVRIDFAIGCKYRTSIRLKNMMQTMPVAFKVQTTSPDKFSVKPPNGFIHPNAEFTFHIIFKSQYQLPENFPLSKEKFLVKSILAPMSRSGNLPERVPSDWFAASTRKVFVDAKLRVVYIGDLLLRYSVAREDINSVKHILKRQTCCDGCDETGRTSIHIAAANGSLEIIKALLEGGAKVHLMSKRGQTPLLEAAYMGHREAMKMLLDYGADIEAKNPRGWTAIHLASILNHLDIVRLLIDRGVNLDAKDNEGRTALHSAVTEGHVECVQLLLGAGANKDACSLDGRSAIFRAAAKGNVGIVRLLMDLEANTAIKSTSGQSPFDVAMVKGHTAVMDALCLGEDLLKAARRGEVKTVTSSLKKGADVNRRDQWGWTGLHCAALKGHVEVVAKLLEYGADVRQADSEGHTALHCAVEGGHREVAQLLVSRGADVQAKNKKGVTPLQIAAALPYKSISKILTMISSAGHNFLQETTQISSRVSPKPLSQSSSMKVAHSSSSSMLGLMPQQHKQVPTDQHLQKETVTQPSNFYSSSGSFSEEKEAVTETRKIWSMPRFSHPLTPLLKEKRAAIASGPPPRSTTEPPLQAMKNTRRISSLPRISKETPTVVTTAESQSSPHLRMVNKEREVSHTFGQIPNLRKRISSMPRLRQTPTTTETHMTTTKERDLRTFSMVTRSSSLYNDHHQQQQNSRHANGRQLRECLEEDGF